MAFYDSLIDLLHGDEPPLSESDKISLTLLTEKALESDYSNDAIKAGFKAPSFSLPDTSGVIYNSLDWVRKGPVVLVFFRGLWCWYSYLRLKELETAVEKVRARGASILAISPQLTYSAQDAARKSTISFPILCDKYNKTALDYGVCYQLPAQLNKLYKNLGVSLSIINQDDVGTLPHSSQFIINKQGVIVLSEVNTDYTGAALTDELLMVLDCMPAARAPRSLK